MENTVRDASDLKSLTGRIRFAVGRMPQAELARRIGISPQAVGKIMSGRTQHIRPDTLKNIANVTGYTIEWLTTGIGIRTAQRYLSPEKAELLAVAESLPDAYAKSAIRMLKALPSPEDVEL